MSRYIKLFSSLLSLVTLPLQGQVPVTDLFLLNLERSKDSLSAVKLFSISPQPGYNNQPSFSFDEKSLYFSSAPKNGITEVWVQDLRNNKNRILGHTTVSEYSPREVFAGQLHVVCVEKDSSQHIHRLNALNGAHETVLEPDSVGYYCFQNKDTLVYYKLSEPHSLYVYCLSEKKEVWLCDKPGRSFQALDRHRLLYIQKDSMETVVLIYDFALHKAQQYATAPPEAENFMWHPSLGLLRSEASRIMQWQEKEKRWICLLELKSFGLNEISRFSLSQNIKHLAVVQRLPDK